MPFYFEKYAYKWLESALDYGIAEDTYWDMTLAEAIRAIKSKKRVEKARAMEKASFDYIQAELIGRSIARLYSSSARMPQIQEVYPSLFDNEEIEKQRQQKKMELSVLRFKTFAQTYNKKYEEVGEK